MWKIVCGYKENKEESNRKRLTVGSDRINYPGYCVTPTADILFVKILFNSVLSTMDAEFMTLDILKTHLNTPLARYEYIRLKMADLLEDFIEEYKLG